MQAPEVAFIDWMETFLAEHPEAAEPASYGHATSVVDYLRATAPARLATAREPTLPRATA